ncbi:hypothetical protein BG011_008729 [Mortierella polycephala]|uniref:Bromodomain-containing protein n=1 Tax=Mortierella polycephala TaxID=41804 RepID=A0A9P6PQK0_9FUNG|nr:hypothetical protein BG011_008729 [Mortierella polycephala]
MAPRKKSAAAKGPASIAEGLALESKQEAMAQILERLQDLTDKNGRSISDLFVELPDREEYPDYYEVIKTPMAFDMIKERLETGEYKDEGIDNFAKDLRTLTMNAKTYNRDGSMVYRDATTLDTYIDVAIKALMDDGAQQPKREEFSTKFCHNVLETIKTHEDKDGREMAELFLELPSKEEYPDYYDEISKPIAINIIEEKIDQGVYHTLELFEKDMNLMFENAKLYNAEGSDVYLDAEELQQLFWKTIGKNGRGRQTKGRRARKHNKELSDVEHGGDTYRVGDFVHIQNDSDPSKPTIGLIFSIWEDEKGIKGIDAVWFLRPEHIIHPYASRFYPSEVVKASGVHEHLVDDILERCFVLQTKDYIRGRPENWNEGQSIYVCEQRYNDSYKSVTKIKNWASCLPPGHKPGDIQLNMFSHPLVLKKLPSASMMDKAGKQDSSENASRASSPRNSASSKSWSPESTPKAMIKSESTPIPAPTLKKTKSNKRKSTQMTPGSPPLHSVKVKSDDAGQPAPIAPPRVAASSLSRFHCLYSSLATKAQCTA